MDTKKEIINLINSITDEKILKYLQEFIAYIAKHGFS